MCAQTTRLSDRQLKAVKPKDKDYVLTDGDGPTTILTQRPIRGALCCLELAFSASAPLRCDIQVRHFR